MFKQIIPIALLGATLVGFSACKQNGGFKKTKDGIEYNIVKDVPGTQMPKIGDIIEYHMIVKIGDSVLADTRKAMNGQPVQKMLQEVPAANKKMDPTEVLTMLTPGDSVVIRTEIDSNMHKMFTFAKPTDKLEYQFVLVSVKTKDQAQKEAKEKASAQAQVDDKILTDYFTKNNIKAQKTASGLYYVIATLGAGENPTPGKTVSVNYTGKTIDGVVFDSNLEQEFQHVKPLEFPIGQGQVIPGWDEGIALLKKGAKATLYVPSTLAYGAQSPNPKIPANGILVFDVQLLDIK
jgi:FKBP-type peptidyl-prolyl cis-trans isomerase FkpA